MKEGAKDRWYKIGGLIFFVLLIMASSYIGDLRSKSKLTIEEHIAGAYCSNLREKLDTDKKWDDCYNDVIDNVSMRFDELESCKKESKNDWNSENWKSCYSSKSWGL